LTSKSQLSVEAAWDRTPPITALMSEIAFVSTNAISRTVQDVISQSDRFGGAIPVEVRDVALLVMQVSYELHASFALTDNVQAHVRPKDFSRHRAAFSGLVAAANIAPATLVLAMGG
jgi:hypothetical protein